MRQLERLTALLPQPYAEATDSTLARFLDVFALEMEVIQEDLDRLRQTHWVRFAYRLEDLEKLGALVGERRFPWETLRMFWARLLAVVAARLNGAIGQKEIKQFVFEYLRSAQEEIPQATFVPGLRTVSFEEAFGPTEDRSLFNFIEYPPRTRRSAKLLARRGRTPYLYRWTESNNGLDKTVATFAISGYPQGRTAAPVLVNRTTGDLIGYAGRVEFGQTLVLEAAGEGRAARARIGDADVTDRLYSISGFVMGVPFEAEDLDPVPQLPQMTRGKNDWIYLAVGLYDVKGLNRFFYAIADDNLREGVFNETFFDQAVFPSGPTAKLEMEWIETEPAAFEVRVPRFIVITPPGLSVVDGRQPHEQVEEALVATVQRLRAAGVRASVRFKPFSGTQPQRDRLQLPWKVLQSEPGPSGQVRSLELGGRFGETRLDQSRFE